MLNTLTELRIEFVARGFNYIDPLGSTTRQDQYLNQAYLELCEEDLWPFLLASASGPSPLALTDLRSVQSVYEADSRRTLPYSDVRALFDNYGDVTRAGAPSYFYIDNGTIRTCPVGGNLQVRYWKVPAQLAAADTPLVPLRFRNLIVDGACRRAYIDSDNFEAAAAVEGERQAGVERMRQSLLWQNNAETEFVVAAEGEDW